MQAMIGDLLRGLLAPDPAPLADPDARVAMAALLVRVGRSGTGYTEAEVARIDRILTLRYDLSPFAAIDLRRQAEVLEAEAPDTVRFTRAIKDCVDLEHRQSVIEAMWEVVLADGIRESEEDAQMRLLANLLGISDRDSNIARLRVENRLA